MENNTSNILNSLGNTAQQLGDFLNNIQKTLNPEQKAELDKEMKGNFAKEMNKVQSDISKAIEDINNFNASQVK